MVGAENRDTGAEETAEGYRLLKKFCFEVNRYAAIFFSDFSTGWEHQAYTELVNDRKSTVLRMDQTLPCCAGNRYELVASYANYVGTSVKI